MKTEDTTLAGLLDHARFDAQGLIPVVAQDARSREVLMLAWMTREALKETLASGRMCYWSRARGQLWRKGETSGHTQKLVALRLDCDGDSLLALVEQTGPACHTYRPTCFYNEFDENAPGGMKVTCEPVK